jgi:hypothetical protein
MTILLACETEDKQLKDMLEDYAKIHRISESQAMEDLLKLALLQDLIFFHATGFSARFKKQKGGDKK